MDPSYDCSSSPTISFWFLYKPWSKLTSMVMDPYWESKSNPFRGSMTIAPSKVGSFENWAQAPGRFPKKWKNWAHRLRPPQSLGPESKLVSPVALCLFLPGSNSATTFRVNGGSGLPLKAPGGFGHVLLGLRSEAPAPDGVTSWKARNL